MTGPVRYEAFVGNVDPSGLVAMTFNPPIDITQALVDEAVGSVVNRVTVENELVSRPNTSRYSFAVAGAAEEPDFYGLPVRLRELGARICWLVEARDQGADARDALLQGFSAAPIIDLVVTRSVSEEE